VLRRRATGLFSPQRRARDVQAFLASGREFVVQVHSLPGGCGCSRAAGRVEHDLSDLSRRRGMVAAVLRRAWSKGITFRSEGTGREGRPSTGKGVEARLEAPPSVARNASCGVAGGRKVTPIEGPVLSAHGSRVEGTSPPGAVSAPHAHRVGPGGSRALRCCRRSMGTTGPLVVITSTGPFVVP